MEFSDLTAPNSGSHRHMNGHSHNKVDMKRNQNRDIRESRDRCLLHKYRDNESHEMKLLDQSNLTEDQSNLTGVEAC